MQKRSTAAATRLLRTLSFREITGHGNRFPALRFDFANDGTQRILAARRENEAAALLSEHQRRCPADAARGPGDDRDFAAESEVHGVTIEVARV